MSSSIETIVHYFFDDREIEYNAKLLGGVLNCYITVCLAGPTFHCCELPRTLCPKYNFAKWCPNSGPQLLTSNGLKIEKDAFANSKAVKYLPWILVFYSIIVLVYFETSKKSLWVIVTLYYKCAKIIPSVTGDKSFPVASFAEYFGPMMPRVVYYCTKSANLIFLFSMTHLLQRLYILDCGGWVF